SVDAPVRPQNVDQRLITFVAPAATFVECPSLVAARRMRERNLCRTYCDVCNMVWPLARPTVAFVAPTATFATMVDAGAHLCNVRRAGSIIRKDIYQDIAMTFVPTPKPITASI